jgi:hypothetical protein
MYFGLFLTLFWFLRRSKIAEGFGFFGYAILAKAETT